MKREFRPSPELIGYGPAMSTVNYLRMQINNSLVTDEDGGEKAREIKQKLLDYLEGFKGNADADYMILQLKGIAELEVK